MISDDRRRLVMQEMQRGDEARRAAEVLFRERLLRDTMSRAYYAVLHYARALLILKAEEPRTHEGVLRRFSLHFVKSGLIGPEEGKVLGRLHKFRQEADYTVERDYPSEEVCKELEGVVSFRDAVVRALGELGMRES